MANETANDSILRWRVDKTKMMSDHRLIKFELAATIDQHHKSDRVLAMERAD